MSAVATTEERAKALVTVASKVRGGPWFVQLGGLLDPPVWLGPYANKSLANEDAERIRAYLVAWARDAGRSGLPAG
jgi:hypothetical protein